MPLTLSSYSNRIVLNILLASLDVKQSVFVELLSTTCFEEPDKRNHQIKARFDARQGPDLLDYSSRIASGAADVSRPEELRVSDGGSA